MIELAESLWTAADDATAQTIPKVALGESRALLAAMIDQMPMAVGLMNAKGQMILYNRKMEPYVSARDGAHLRWRAFDGTGKPVPPDQWPPARALKGETVSPGMEFLYSGGDGTELWTRVSAAPLLVTETGIQYAMAVVEDIDDLKRAEQQVKLMGRELEHRTNNILARVEAIINLTKADTVQEFFAAVQNRIGSLSRTDKLFSKARSSTLPFRKLLEQELSPYSVWHDGGIELEGPPFTVGPGGAEALGMVFHELTTNAAKYGALSHADGKLRVEWSRVPPSGVAITWSETGAQNVGAPSRKGFGTRVLDAIIRRQLGGKIEYQWNSDGLTCRFETQAEKLGARFDS